MEDFKLKLKIIQEQLIRDFIILDIDKFYELYQNNEKDCVEYILCYCIHGLADHYCNNLLTENISCFSSNVKKQILYEIMINQYKNNDLDLNHMKNYYKWFFENLDELVEYAKFVNSKLNFKNYINKLKNTFGEDILKEVISSIENAPNINTYEDFLEKINIIDNNILVKKISPTKCQIKLKEIKNDKINFLKMI